MRATLPPVIHPVSPGSARHELMLMRRAASAFFKFHGLRGQWHQAWLRAHPLNTFELPSKASPRDRRLSEDELKVILACMRSDIARAAILFSICTTLRRGELVSLQWNDVDWGRKVVKLRRPDTDRKSKTRTRDVPLVPAALTILSNIKRASLRPDGRLPEKIFPVRKGSLTQAWGRACQRMGIQNARWHDIRREAVSRLIEKYGLSLELVKVFSGHRDLRTLQEYYVHVLPSLVAAEAEKIEATRPLVSAETLALAG